MNSPGAVRKVGPNEKPRRHGGPAANVSPIKKAHMCRFLQTIHYNLMLTDIKTKSHFPPRRTKPGGYAEEDADACV